MAQPLGPPSDAPSRILDVAEALVQTRGFNGFSYSDVATQLAVTNASLHYHFRTKADLGRALIVRYRETFLRTAARIEAEPTPTPEKLARYAELYRAVLEDGRMCLCGMVAAEYATLPKPMQSEIRRFFTVNEAWLAKIVERGARAGELRVPGTPLDAARFVVSSLEGAMLVARAYGSVERFDEAARRLLAELRASPPGKAADDGPARGSPSRGAAPRPRANRRPAGQTTRG